MINSCSTTKNTWLSRNYQALNTRFNVLYNGRLSYDEGLRNILKANKDDYSTLIPMFPISHHKNAAAATSNMDRTIEKCRKSIKLHSIKVKPQKNYKKENLPEYKLFYNQEEFNPELKNAWILLGQAEFHKADFLGASSTFSYIERHYSTDKTMVATCQLWIVRSYAEMGWIYEAEQVLSQVKQDDVTPSIIGLFASTNADLLLKRGQYNEAIPFLQLALSKESDKQMKMRFSYLLAQLYQKTNDNKNAYAAYSRVLKMNPPFEMDFYARVNRTQLDIGNITNVRNELKKMLKKGSNKEYLDQIYYAIGNTYLHHADTLKAIENYKLSVKKSTRKSIDQGVTLVTLGDIYYKRHNYVAAQPCYDEASKIISNESEDYARVSRRAETLSELIVQYNTVQLQDSLQRLATLSENERMAIVLKIIEKLKADEKAAAQQAKMTAQQSLTENELGNMAPIGMNMPGNTGDWYFYNPDILRSGQAAFLKKWGNRKLEDNWRRTDKAASLFNDQNLTSNSQQTDSASATVKADAVTDNKKPEFYLRQIPVTAAQLQQSNAQIASALFAMGQIYKDKIEDTPLAISTFENFIQLFSSDERVPDAYFQLYLMEIKNGNQDQAEVYRQKLLTQYPHSKYHDALVQPNYVQRLEEMYHEQDSIYSLTYQAYNQNDFKTVFKNVQFIQKNDPLSTLMPKFLFLNALSIGKSESPDKFRVALDSLVTDYPQSDVSGMAKDIMALMKQGKIAKTGTTGGTLLAKRQEEETQTANNDTISRQFSSDKQTKHRVLFITSDSIQALYNLQYQIASYNFSRFMIKDFDLVINRIDSTQQALSVTNFESYNEAQWYLSSIASDSIISSLIRKFDIQSVIISEDNFGLLRTTFKLNDYLAFLKKQKENPELIAQTSTKKKSARILPVEENKSSDQNQRFNSSSSKAEKPLSQAVHLEPIKNDTVKPSTQAIQTMTDKTATGSNTTISSTAKTETISSNKPTQSVPPAPAQILPKEPAVPLFKGLYAYKENELHYIAIDVLSGKIDFDKIKASFDSYNTQNYSLLNLKTTLENINNQQVIIIGSFQDAKIAKSYLLRMVKQNALFEGLKNADYRNLLGSQKNLNIAVQQNSLNTYFEFMQAYYLK